MIATAFTLIGAFLLSFVKVSDKRLKVEAIIGIFYAVASAVTVLLISKAAHGDADIQEVLFGSFFTVTDGEIWWTAGVFAALGVMHFVFREKFFDLTEKIENHDIEDIGMFNVWNFLFYIFNVFPWRVQVH